MRWFKEQYFGRSSQKSASAVSPDQKMLFNEAEVLAAIEAADAAHAARTNPVKAHERQHHSGGREPIPEHLPRREIVHDLSNAEKYCEHEGVCWSMDCIDREISERYHYEPPQLGVERHIRPKWACGRCHQGVRIAPCPAHILPKTNASASLLAHFIASKFVDGLPLYRVCQQLERQQVRIAEDPKSMSALRRCMAVGRELTSLERLVGIDRDPASAVRYTSQHPAPSLMRYDKAPHRRARAASLRAWGRTSR